MKRSLIALILCISMILPTVVSCSKFKNDTQHPPSTNDTTDTKNGTDNITEKKTETKKENETDVKYDKGSANLKSTVIIYDDTYTKKIENSIVAIEESENGMVLAVDGDSPISDLTENAVFVIRGDKDSVFGEVYFGKVDKSTPTDSGYIYDISTPAFDEVFSAIDLDLSADMSYENMISVSSAAGVTIQTGSDYVSKQILSQKSSAPFTTNATNLSLKDSDASTLGIGDNFDYDIDGNDIILTFELDILKLLQEEGIIDVEDSDSETVRPSDANNMTVYYTDTGVCYHRETCHCLAKSKYPTSLKDAVHEKKLKACKICKAPILLYDDVSDYVESSEELKLDGQVSLLDLSFNILGKNGKDWTLTQGFDDLSLQTKGKLIAETTLTGDFEATIQKNQTSSSIGNDEDWKITFEGLEKKLFPIAFITWNGGNFAFRVGPESDEVSAPFTIGLMIYTDIYGNIVAGTEIFCSYERSLDYKMDVFRDGEFVAIKNNGLNNSQNSSDFDWHVKAELKAAVDFEILACSLMVYVGNLNILELCIAKVGAEADCFASVYASDEKVDDYFTADANLCIYVEMFDLDLKFKFKSFILNIDAQVDPDALIRIELLKLSGNYSAEYDGDVCLADLEPIVSEHYEGNEGDSRIFILEGEEYRNGNIGINGDEYQHGFEVWIARWNGIEEISWVRNVYALNSKYTALNGKTGLIVGSYNSDNFDTTIYFYGDGTLLDSIILTNEDYQHEFEIDVTNVQELEIFVQDNIAVCGGTSFALYDLFLTRNLIYTRMDAEGNPDANGEYILFGEYPQTIKTDDVTITSEIDARGYYLGTDGTYYAKVTATPWGRYSFSTGENVASGTEYYFKVEPIRWRILSENERSAFILCDSILANGAYDSGNHNNYADSDVRMWLNESFYKLAFHDLQQALIYTTTVNNSASTTGDKANSHWANNPYACENTKDKVFLLSWEEATCLDYGFDAPSINDPARCMQVSDYARATGARMSTIGDDSGNGFWWLRSPIYYSNSGAYFVFTDGHIGHDTSVNDLDCGIVPALQIRLL